MQNTEGVRPNTGDPLAHLENSPASDPSTGQDSLSLSVNPSTEIQSGHFEVQEKFRRQPHSRTVFYILAIFLLLAGGIFTLMRRGSPAELQAGSFGVVHIPLDDGLDSDIGSTAESLKVNGQLQVNNSIVLTPTSQPTNPVTGQLYFDQTSNRLAYYDGQQFVDVVGDTSSEATNTTNIFNSAQSPTSVLLQSSSPGVQQAGNFNISGTGMLGALKTSVIDSSGTTLYLNPTLVTAPSQSGGTNASLGLATLGSFVTGTGINGALVATKVTLGEVGGTAKSITVYINGGSTSNHIQVGLYDDDGDLPSKPGTLLAASAVTNLTPNAFNTLVIPSAGLTANGTYWLAFNTDDPNLTRPFNSGIKTTCFITSGFGFMPDPFSPPGCFFASEVYTITLNYVTANVGAGSIGKAHMSISQTGQTVFQNSEDSPTAFQIQNALGTSTIFNIDTLNGRLAIGKASAAYKLDIAAGDINLSTGRSLRFGGLQALTVNGAGTTTSLTNFQSGGTVSVQADNFVVQDANATHQSLTIDSNGAATFNNRVNTAAGFRIQNAAGQTMVNVDTSAGNIALITTGTGNISVNTGATTGVSGNISIMSGASSTTASGDITIDAGAGIIDGTVVANKTFEGGLENVENWFGSSVALTSTQQHGGINSLAMTATDSFWGLQENTGNPLTPVVPGHQYHFSLWVRAATTPRTITSRAVWVGSASAPTNLQVVVDSATGWTQITGTGIAPAGATGTYITIQGIASVGEVHYFDDIVITDLSSASAVSAINIGDTNAKVITIGNLNQIGATSIFGGSGINLSSGVSGITLNGGVLSITGNAASSLSTTSGALTITSAASAIWGISTAASGPGGDLTLRAGTGAAGGNENGGDLLLQGGSPSGTGAPGSVTIRAASNANDTFQIQNSGSTSLFTADTSGMNIIVSGTNTSFASLVIADAHFRSTQTTAPTIDVPTNCGTTPSALVTAGSTDSAGSFSITTGTGGSSSTCDTNITFQRPYGAAPKSILVVGRANAASALRQVFVSAATPTTFTVAFGTSASGADNTTYSFSYWVIE